MGASIEASVSEGVPELSVGINYSCRIMPQPVRIWVTPRKDWNSGDIFSFSQKSQFLENFVKYRFEFCMKSHYFSALICEAYLTGELENFIKNFFEGRI